MLGYGFSGIFNFMFTIVFFIFIGVFVVMFVKGIAQWNKNNHSPRLRVTDIIRTTFFSGGFPPTLR